KYAVGQKRVVREDQVQTLQRGVIIRKARIRRQTRNPRSAVRQPKAPPHGEQDRPRCESRIIALSAPNAIAPSRQKKPTSRSDSKIGPYSKRRRNSPIPPARAKKRYSTSKP